MADFTKNISNTVNVFGMSPTSLWGDYNWNAFKWGEGTQSLAVNVTHLISESITPDDAIINATNHLISESISLAGDLDSETLGDGSGYSYIFPSNTSDGEDRAFTSFACGSAQGSSWTCAVVGSTSWS